MGIRQMNVPAKKTPERIEIESFYGADFSSAIGEVDMRRSPDMKNMISASNGRIIKRRGYSLKTDFGEKTINGIFTLAADSGDDTLFVHAGTYLYYYDSNGDETALSYSGAQTFMSNERSIRFQMNGDLYILDGAEYWKIADVSGAWTVSKVTDNAYIPTTSIARNTGTGDNAGRSLDKVNLLQPKRINSFYATEAITTTTDFVLDFVPDSDTVTARIVNSSGEWEDAACAFYNRAKKIVRFSAAHTLGGATGVDNVEITASKTVSGYADRIKKATAHILFGVTGYDQVFLAGSGKKNHIYYSATGDPSYFPDVNYITAGQDNSAVMGFLRVSEGIAAIKEHGADDASAFLITASVNSETAAVSYSVKQGTTGVGAVSKTGFADFLDDPVFLTPQGVMAIVSSAVTSDKFVQPRSELINRRLTKQTLSSAVLRVFNGYLYLAADGVCYVADGSQKNYQGKSAESFNYEWYYWTNMPVRVWGEFDDTLLFGSEDGKLYEMNGSALMSAYSDNGTAIEGYYVTPLLDLGYLEYYKTLRYLYATFTPYARSSCKLYVMIDGAWEYVDEAYLDLLYFNNLSFKRFSFNVNKVSTQAFSVKEKLRVTVQFKFVSNELNEGFGLEKAVIQYIIGSRVK